MVTNALPFITLKGRIRDSKEGVGYSTHTLYNLGVLGIGPFIEEGDLLSIIREIWSILYIIDYYC